MNQDNQESNKEASANASMKRKRGRPRKHPRQSAVPRFLNMNHRENAHVPPGFQGVNGNRLRPVDPIHGGNDVVVGQVVHGVIEASFDAGYLLNVKVGNSETTLRGIVLKPGQYVPVSAANDVAPNLPMVRRNEIPIPEENLSQVPASNSQSRDRREQHVNPRRNGTASLGGSQGKRGTSIPIQPAHPVFSKNIFQPVNLPGGGAVAKRPSSVPRQVNHLEASKDKQVTGAAIPSNVSKFANPVQTVGNQVSPLQAQTIPEGMLCQPSSALLHEAEAKAMQLPAMPFEKLLSEVIKRVQAPPQSVGTGNGKKIDDFNSKDQALSIEPLQAVQPNVIDHSGSLSKPFDNFKSGKMTELLRAVQENMMEKQAPLQLNDPPPGADLSFEKLSSPVAEVGDQENDHSKKHPRLPVLDMEALP